MASPQPSLPSAPSTPIPKSYAKGVAMTADPLEACAALEYGADRSFAWSVQQQVVQTPPEGRARLEEQLLAALALPRCTDAGRAFLCQMLTLLGSAKSVPVLGRLVRDVKTSEAARHALEAIPGAEADAALRGALGSLSGAPKAGLIGSIAARRDVTARPEIAALKDARNEPAVVREAAARALASLETT